MNVTEQFEEILRLARQSPHAWEPTAKRAIAAFEKRTHHMRCKLTAARRVREFRRRRDLSFGQLRDALLRLPECTACRWKPTDPHWQFGLINPLLSCTGAFGCALECLRYKSSAFHPIKP